ncbi:hypothetical protein O6H91_13G067700 [Diphasiastrum complanatum]|uniref:Uncharacterized protein n=2 Tax=Diphasiastrum complanatum TaxID=34168 RepID=A0ACC2BWU3_DIPCM|nr:hypothetical protein O6H91_13G067700 [Diphasiastrum complanatum]KAJ7533853.1 hypothetical protein O6H91_13G067700 [Diphasiastrum complanatum]
MDSCSTKRGNGKAPAVYKCNPRPPLTPVLAALSLERYSHLYGYLTANRSKQATEQSVHTGHGYLKYELEEILKLHGLSASGINKTEALQRISGLDLFNPYRCIESASKTRPVFARTEIEQDLVVLDWLDEPSQVQTIEASPDGVILNSKLVNENPTALKTSRITTTLLLPSSLLNEKQAFTKRYEPFSQASDCKEIINLNHQHGFQASPVVQNIEAVSLQEVSKSVTVPQPSSAARSKSLTSHNSLLKQRKSISVLHKYKALKAEINKNARQRNKNVSLETDALLLERRENV